MYYFISYDLQVPGQKYENVLGYLRSYPYCMPVRSGCIILTEKSLSQVTRELKSYLDDNDKFFVIDFTGKTYTWNSLSQPENVNQWLNNPPKK